MKTEKQQTAVEWYAEEAMRLEIKKIKGNISVYQMLNELSNVLNQAKEMERQQIKFFFDKGHLYSGCQFGLEECYNKNFNKDEQ